MAAGTKRAASRFSSLGPSAMSRACNHPCTRLKTLPLRIMRPMMNGKVPASTPAADQPMPLSRLEMATAAPKTPVINAVPASRLRPEITGRILFGHQPTFVDCNLVGTLDIFLDEFVEGLADQKRID